VKYLQNLHGGKIIVNLTINFSLINFYLAAPKNKRMNADLTKLSIDTVRVLAADAVQKANSGHPGTPMATAPMGHVLWTRAMNYNAKNPEWANRDRFILSAGHACMLHIEGRSDVAAEDNASARTTQAEGTNQPRRS